MPNASEQGKEDLQNLSPEQVSKLYEKFGVDTVPELAASSSSQLVFIEVCSSQEILASQASAAPPDVNYKQYTCSHAVALVRLFPDGSQTTATMKVGPGSFALGCFSSEEEHESEIPNSMVLAMDPKVKKAAKAAAKAAAMALKRPASKAPADSGSLKAMKKPAFQSVVMPRIIYLLSCTIRTASRTPFVQRLAPKPSSFVSPLVKGLHSKFLALSRMLWLSSPLETMSKL